MVYKLRLHIKCPSRTVSSRGAAPAHNIHCRIAVLLTTFRLLLSSLLSIGPPVNANTWYWVYDPRLDKFTRKYPKVFGRLSSFNADERCRATGRLESTTFPCLPCPTLDSFFCRTFLTFFFTHPASFISSSSNRSNPLLSSFES